MFCNRRRPQFGGWRRVKQLGNTLQTLTVEEKVGQMVMMGVPGTEVGHEASTLIEQYHVGGIMLFAENVETPGQVAEFTYNLQQLARAGGARVPLFIAIDQEGGRVVRIRDGVTPLPSQMAIGASGSVAFAEQVGRIIGTELAAMGINMNAAPVMDVNNNPNNPVIGIRSFGEEPHSVAEYGTAFIHGMQAHGVLATAKHFPGHGDTDVDSHLALPTIVHPRERLDQIELVPFRAAIAAGVAAIMSAHITFPAVDSTPGLPSTLSHPVLTGLLRNELGFQGLIVTDALEMKGVADQYAFGEAAIMAVRAGADIVLIAQSRYNMDGVQAIEALVQAVRDGTIPMDRIDESVGRILAAKEQTAVATVGTDVAHRSGVIASEESTETVHTVARNAVTVVRNEDEFLPISPEAVGTLLVVRPALDRFVLADELRARMPRVEEVLVSLRPTEAEIRAVLQAADNADTIIVATAAATIRPEQVELVRALHELEQKMVVLAVAEPYDLVRFPHVRTYVATYGSQPLHVRSAVEVLFGEQPARGRLPVSIPSLYEAGHGLRL